MKLTRYVSTYKGNHIEGYIEQVDKVIRKTGNASGDDGITTEMY